MAVLVECDRAHSAVLFGFAGGDLRAGRDMGLHRSQRLLAPFGGEIGLLLHRQTLGLGEAIGGRASKQHGIAVFENGARVPGAVNAQQLEDMLAKR